MSEGPSAGGDVAPLAQAVQDARASGDRHRAVVAELEFQSAACGHIGSPLYAHLLARLAEDARDGGVTWQVLAPYADDPPFSALGLRLMAAVHRLVLSGKAPGLARHYPSAGGDLGVDGAWEAFIDLLRRSTDRVRAGTARPCQTNEPGRSAALLGGFLTVARDTGLPLRVLEVGASAGLNLRWDHFRYVDGDRSWGPEVSPVVFDQVFEVAPPLDVETRVVERRGCDPRRQDPASAETSLNLRSSAWPDQLERFTALEGALEVARQVPAVVDRADGPSWLTDHLAAPRPGVATVVFHSIVMQYLSDGTRAQLRDVIAGAGARATTEAPMAWLSMEPGGSGWAHVNLATWPGGERRLVAEAGYHGRPVRWLAVPGPVRDGQGAY